MLGVVLNLHFFKKTLAFWSGKSKRLLGNVDHCYSSWLFSRKKGDKTQLLKIPHILDSGPGGIIHGRLLPKDWFSECLKELHKLTTEKSKHSSGDAYGPNKERKGRMSLKVQ